MNQQLDTLYKQSMPVHVQALTHNKQTKKGVSSWY
jgi:hypothetical protein